MQIRPSALTRQPKTRSTIDATALAGPIGTLALLALLAGTTGRSAAQSAAGRPAPAPAVARAAAPDARLDLLIRGGTVHDGRGGAGVVADVGVDGDRIVRIGDLGDLGDLGDAAATRVIDARGLAVAPGFIDVHAHADAVAARRPDAANFVSMGVTTIVTGNCGRSMRDLRSHFERIEKGGFGINYASLVGHGTVREAVLGRANRAPTDGELAGMKELVRAGMAAGAVGLSTGLIYVPGTYAKTAEIAALCEVVAEYGGLYATHMRHEGGRVLDSIAEALEIGKAAGVPVHISHLKASGKPNWGKGQAIVELLRAARTDGRRVTGDQYAYTASSTGLEVLFPTDALSIGLRAFGEKLQGDAAFRARMTDALSATMDASGFGDFSYCQIASAPQRSELNGMRIDAAADQVYGSATRADQARLVIDLVVAANGPRVSMVYHKMCEDDVETIMREPYVAVASDSGIRALGASPARPHPRGAGNNPRVLGRYVRERGTLQLPLAVRKMTLLPATIFGLEDRGEIRPGAFADLTVFDPAEVLDGATYEDPRRPPVGMQYVVVNGVVVLDRGERRDARPGRVLRRRVGEGR